MKKLTLQQITVVSGAMNLEGLRQSTNVIDLRDGYAKTHYLGAMRWNPFQTYRYFGRLW